jgi:hypothetical protein
MSKRLYCVALICSATSWAASLHHVAAAENSFVGDWALTIPGGHAGWLGVREGDRGLQASLMWGAGSVLPLDSATLDGDRLILVRTHAVQRKDASGKSVKTNITETLTATVKGDEIHFSSLKAHEDGQGSKCRKRCESARPNSVLFSRPA